MTLAEAQKAIAIYDLRKFGLELIPMPASGGCVIAIRELPRAEARLLSLRLPWVDWINQVRAEVQLRAVLRTLSIASTTTNA